ncbi:MAG: carbon-nitrogen hydrolase family protein [Planctomycetes bacterium]|nr:carbon-nitrogen hydrolase family protein [Planctomycetota bacterium]
MVLTAGAGSSLPAWAHQTPATPATASIPAALTVGVVQQAREPQLAANRDKIVRFTAAARARGCRLAIFPEDALGSPVGTSNEDLEQAVDAIREAARVQDIYVIFCSSFAIPGFAPDRRGHCLRVIGPDGRLLLRFNKLICNLPASDPRRAPGVFHVDGIPCGAMICADRWLRGFEELPVALGARILIDCSANARQEWIPEFAWYLPVTRALRNNVFSIFCNMGAHPQGLDDARHGHSAIIRPDGTFAAAADDGGDQMLVATLDLSQAHAAEAKRRHDHPVFRPYWELGRRILSGQKATVVLPEPHVSPQVEIKIAAAQMACSRDIPANVERMKHLLGAARDNRADVVVFPELAVTGARDDDIRGADPSALREALAALQAAAKARGITVVFGMPRVEGAKRWNSAFVAGPEGTLLTHYDQLVVDRRDLFQAGSETRPMWFRVKGVPAVVTVGSDARWNEIGELAAVRGAQLLFNLAYDPGVSEAATLRRTQFWVQLASFCTFSATVNATDARSLAQPSTAANGGSTIWEDFNGHRKTPAGNVEVYSQYSACRVVSAGPQETILYATRTMPRQNTYFSRLVARRYPYLEPWYHLGARIVAGVGS